MKELVIERVNGLLVHSTDEWLFAPLARQVRPTSLSRLTHVPFINQEYNLGRQFACCPAHRPQSWGFRPLEPFTRAHVSSLLLFASL